MASDAVQYGSSHLSTCLSKQKPNGESIPFFPSVVSLYQASLHSVAQHLWLSIGCDYL